MTTYTEEAKEEMKRADHLLFVTLKYARIVDVMYNIIERLNNACDIIVNEAVTKSKKIKETPKTQFRRVKIFRELLKDNKNSKIFIDHYIDLRKLKSNRYSKKGEYRKNVTLISIDEMESVTEINMDKLKDLFKKTFGFIEFFSELIESKKI